MTDAKIQEWPLAVFTVALQFSCGLALAATVAEWSLATPAPAGKLALAAFAIGGVGTAVSLLHVGRPWSAWRSLTNVAHSRLSQEILLTGWFVLAALLYTVMRFVGGSAPRPITSAIAAAFGVLAVAGSARVYRLPGQPFWNAAWLPVSFAGTTLLLGGCAGLALRAGGAGAFRLLLAATVTGGFLTLVSALWMAARLGHLRGRDSAGLRVDRELPPVGQWHWIAFGVHVSVAAAVPIALVLNLGLAANSPLAMAAFVGVLLGAVFGRALLYSLPATLARF